MYSAFSSLDFKLLKHLETTVGISCCASSCPNAIIENALILGLAWANSFEKSYFTLRPVILCWFSLSEQVTH